MRTRLSCFLLLGLFAIASPAWAVNGVADAGIVTAITDVTVTGTATLVKAANMNRVALSCTNTHGSVNVRWGDSAITTTKGQQIKAGASVAIENRGAVYMISEGADVSVSCTEESR